MWIALLILAALAIYLAANVARYILSGEILPWYHPRSVLFTQVLFFAAVVLAGIYTPGGFGPKVFALIGLAIIGAIAFFVYLKMWGSGPVGPCECCAHGEEAGQAAEHAGAVGEAHGTAEPAAPSPHQPERPGTPAGE